MITDFSIILVGLVALVWSADRFIEGAAAIAGRAGMSPLLIGMTIVSVGTSAPEILVSLMAALSNSGELAVGNALGSNIANIGLVLGITLLIAPIRVGKTTAFNDLPVLLIIVLLCAALLWDTTLSSGDALLLFAALAVYLFRMARHVQAPDINDPEPTISEMPLPRATATFAIGLLVLIGSSRALVWSAVNIAEGFGVSELVIGLTIVALGTSLPELAASVVSAMKGHSDIAIGAVVGSNMFNLLIVLSLPGSGLQAAALECFRQFFVVGCHVKKILQVRRRPLAVTVGQPAGRLGDEFGKLAAGSHCLRARLVRRFLGQLVGRLFATALTDAAQGLVAGNGIQQGS